MRSTLVLLAMTWSLCSANVVKLSENLKKSLKISDDHFRVVFVGHPRGTSDKGINSNYESFFPVIKELSPDFLIIGGDLMWADWNKRYKGENHFGEIQKAWDLFVKKTNTLNIPYIVVPGNHEIQNKRSQKIFISNFGPIFGVQKINNYNLVFLDTIKFNGWRTNGISKEQIDMYSKLNKQRVVYFMHHCLWNFDWIGKENFKLEGALAICGDSRSFVHKKFDEKYVVENGIKLRGGTTNHLLLLDFNKSNVEIKKIHHPNRKRSKGNLEHIETIKI